jgi:hypothetical protein
LGGKFNKSIDNLPSGLKHLTFRCYFVKNKGCTMETPCKICRRGEYVSCVRFLCNFKKNVYILPPLLEKLCLGDYDIIPLIKELPVNCKIEMDTPNYF